VEAVVSARRLHHVGVSVSDLDDAIDFFALILGSRPVTLEELEGAAFLDTLVGYGDTHVRVAMFEMGSRKLLLELIEYQRPPSVRLDMETYNVGNTHVCLEVDDIGHEFARLRAAGLEFRSDAPVVEPAGPFRGMKWVYLRSPDGLTVELCQRSTATGPR
jgi:catechol 2,3-dioxygenase-like lactoylglutathione lyase family enzyme